MVLCACGGVDSSCSALKCVEKALLVWFSLEGVVCSSGFGSEVVE